MRVYKVPQNINKEEKLFGYVSIRQLGYIMLFAVLGLIVAFVFPVNLFVRLFVFLIFSTIGTVFAFIHVKDLTGHSVSDLLKFIYIGQPRDDDIGLDKFLFMYLRFLKLKKIYLFNKR